MSLIRSRQGDESTIRLWAWRVIELTANTGEVYRHLIGHTIGGDRTSSPIVAFDTATMTATTRSGQRYELMDEPDVAGLYTTNLLHDWLKKRPITEAIDVSAEYQPAAPAVPSVEDEPTIQLTAWRVIELATDHGGWRHLIGWHTTARCARTSSPITMFDPTTMQVFTETGRRYQLVGPPDPVDLLTDDLWQHYFDASDVTAVNDVTAEYQPAVPSVPSIEDEPITAWAIVELTTDGDTWRCVLTQHTRPLTGYGFCTRMTPITMFDPTTMQVFTETGRRYELVGPPDPVILLAEDFWQEYFARDVTAEYWPTEDTR